MFIPGFIISFVTFPGVIVHEMAHQLFCRWQRVAVLMFAIFALATPRATSFTKGLGRRGRISSSPLVRFLLTPSLGR